MSQNADALAVGAVQLVVQRRARALRKKLTRIQDLESSGKELTPEQVPVVAAKPVLLSALDEVEKISEALPQALAEEVHAAHARGYAEADALTASQLEDAQAAHERELGALQSAHAAELQRTEQEWQAKLDQAERVWQARLDAAAKAAEEAKSAAAAQAAQAALDAACQQPLSKSHPCVSLLREPITRLCQLYYYSHLFDPARNMGSALFETHAAMRYDEQLPGPTRLTQLDIINLYYFGRYLADRMHNTASHDKCVKERVDRALAWLLDPNAVVIPVNPAPVAVTAGEVRAVLDRILASPFTTVDAVVSDVKPPGPGLAADPAPHVPVTAPPLPKPVAPPTRPPGMGPPAGAIAPPPSAATRTLSNPAPGPAPAAASAAAAKAATPEPPPAPHTPGVLRTLLEPETAAPVPAAAGGRGGAAGVIAPPQTAVARVTENQTATGSPRANAGLRTPAAAVAAAPSAPAAPPAVPSFNLPSYLEDAADYEGTAVVVDEPALVFGAGFGIGASRGPSLDPPVGKPAAATPSAIVGSPPASDGPKVVPGKYMLTETGELVEVKQDNRSAATQAPAASLLPSIGSLLKAAPTNAAPAPAPAASPAVAGPTQTSAPVVPPAPRQEPPRPAGYAAALHRGGPATNGQHVPWASRVKGVGAGHANHQ